MVCWHKWWYVNIVMVCRHLFILPLYSYIFITFICWQKRYDEYKYHWCVDIVMLFDIKWYYVNIIQLHIDFIDMLTYTWYFDSRLWYVDIVMVCQYLFIFLVYSYLYCLHLSLFVDRKLYYVYKYHYYVDIVNDKISKWWYVDLVIVRRHLFIVSVYLYFYYINLLTEKDIMNMNIISMLT